MKRKIALLLTAAMLIGMNSVAYAEESADERVGGQVEILADAEAEEQEEIPADAETGGQEETPADAETGGQEEIPADAEIGGQEETSADAETGGQEKIPADAEAGEQEETPADAESGEQEETPADAESGEQVESAPDAALEEVPADAQETLELTADGEAAEAADMEKEEEIRTVRGNEIGAGVFRTMIPEYSVLAERGWGKTIEVNCSMRYDDDVYALCRGEGFSYSISRLKNGADSVILSGNTSGDTKLLSKDFLYGDGDCNLVDVQIGKDEAAEEITITVEFGAWYYYLRNKETGEIIRVTGDEGEQVSITLKVVDRGKGCSFERGIRTDKTSVEPGGETAVRMTYNWIFDADKYTVYNAEGYYWRLGMENCTVSGNTSENTVIEDRRDYANTRYLVVGEDETAEELIITMECGAWTYYVKDKATGEILRVHNDGMQDHQTLQVTVKVGAEVENEIFTDSEQENRVFTEEEVESEDEDSTGGGQQITFANTVTGAGGIKTVSTIDGIYQVTNIAGAAVITPKEQVETAAGITAEEGKVKFYVCNNRNQTVKTALEEAAASNGKQAFTTFNLDLYTINMDGQVNKIYNTTAKVRVVIGIPDKYKNADGPYAVGIIGRDGTFHILEDLDNDPDTITIETDQFGIMALMN